MAIFSFTLPGHPPALNTVMFNKVRNSARLRAAWKTVTVLTCKRLNIPPATGRRRVRITIVLAPKQRGCDPDAYFKALGDALKAAKVLKGDSRHWVEWVQPEYVAGHQAETVLTIEDIDPLPKLRRRD